MSLVTFSEVFNNWKTRELVFWQDIEHSFPYKALSQEPSHAESTYSDLLGQYFPETDVCMRGIAIGLHKKLGLVTPGAHFAVKGVRSPDKETILWRVATKSTKILRAAELYVEQPVPVESEPLNPDYRLAASAALCYWNKSISPNGRIREGLQWRRMTQNEVKAQFERYATRYLFPTPLSNGYTQPSFRSNTSEHTASFPLYDASNPNS